MTHVINANAKPFVRGVSKFMKVFVHGVRTCRKRLQFEIDFNDATLVCDGGHFETHEFVISSCPSGFPK